MTHPPTAVSTEVVVAVDPQRAFAAFTGEFTAWWPAEHHTGDVEMAEGVIEPEVGGRWYERGVDGSECDWGRVLVWDPPGHLALSWWLNPDFEPVPDPDRASRIDVTFDVVDGGTRVQLVHSGLDRHGPGWERISTGVGAPTGWPGILRQFAATQGAPSTDPAGPTHPEETSP